MINTYTIRLSLYVLAVITAFILIYIPLTSDIIIEDPLRRKTLISIPFVLVIVGKLIAIMEKRKNNTPFAKDVWINIGLALALFFNIIS